MTDTANGHSDPVFYDSINQVWFFYDETWTDVIGPFPTEIEARYQLECYADWLDNGDDWHVRVRQTPAMFIFEFHVPGRLIEGPYASFEDAKAARDAHRRSLESHNTSRRNSPA